LKLEVQLEKDLENASNVLSVEKMSKRYGDSVEDKLKLEAPNFSRSDTNTCLIVPNHFKMERLRRFKGF